MQISHNLVDIHILYDHIYLFLFSAFSVLKLNQFIGGQRLFELDNQNKYLFQQDYLKHHGIIT